MYVLWWVRGNCWYFAAGANIWLSVRERRGIKAQINYK